MMQNGCIKIQTTTNTDKHLQQLFAMNILLQLMELLMATGIYPQGMN